MKQLKPILHGRDHACGGADPVPGICDLMELIAGGQVCTGICDLLELIAGGQVCTGTGGGGGDYGSAQTGVHTDTQPGGSSDTNQAITGWPPITIPMAAWNANTTLGLGLYVTWSCQAQVVTRLSLHGASNPVDDATFDNAVTSDSWFVCGNAGWAVDPGEGGTVTSDVTIAVVYDGTGGTYKVRSGALTAAWLTVIPAGVVCRTLWPGSYPIDPAVDLAHPTGDTTSFLRADGAWAAVTFEVEY